eukprot:TRINITY_DN3711_c0_g1_i9.p1 TRINITY_DN3711_c0_g1~~TRINITY_DN3711_c0_g1_i9.p1  ORF type:complete len:236 (+),score=81.56 TRINITY_DN3711_c0_g1_i9:70-777(+)
MAQTYPPGSPCGSGTTVYDLSLSSYDGIYARTDGGKCVRITRSDDQQKLTVTSLSNSAACPTAVPTTDQIGCNAGQAATLQTYDQDLTPSQSLMGTWQGTVWFALPDIYGGCVQSSCANAQLQFTATSATITLPSGCDAGQGSSTISFDPSQYDGTFYRDNDRSRCTRLVVDGNTLYRSQMQNVANCPVMDLPAPDCSTGGSLIWEKYTRSPAIAAAPLLSLIAILGLLSIFFLG